MTTMGKTAIMYLIEEFITMREKTIHISLRSNRNYTYVMLAVAHEIVRWTISSFTTAASNSLAQASKARSKCRATSGSMSM